MTNYSWGCLCNAQLLEHLSRTPHVGMWLYFELCLNGGEESCVSLFTDRWWGFYIYIYIYIYAFFWVIPQNLNFICQHFGTACSFFIGGYEDGTGIVPKRWHIKFICQGITQKEAYNLQNTVKVWNQERVVVVVVVFQLNLQVDRLMLKGLKEVV